MASAPNPRQRAAHEPLYDINPATGASIEVFYADRTLETFGRCGAGWFWWSRQRGFPPAGPPTGPFPTSYGAYRHAMNAAATSSSITPDAALAEVLEKLGGGRSRAKPVSMPNSLLTGNFSGNFTILRLQERAPRQEGPALQALLTKFSARVNREKISKNREF